MAVSKTELSYDDSSILCVKASDDDRTPLYMSGDFCSYKFECLYRWINRSNRRIGDKFTKIIRRLKNREMKEKT